MVLDIPGSAAESNSCVKLWNLPDPSLAHGHSVVKLISRLINKQNDKKLVHTQ